MTTTTDTTSTPTTITITTITTPTDTTVAATIVDTMATSDRRNVAINDSSQQQQQQQQRNAKRATAVTSIQTTNTTTAEQMPNATNVAKHQPKKKKSVHHSANHNSCTLRRTFSMTDEEFEEYIDEEETEKGQQHATVAKSKCSIAKEEDEDSLVETTTSEDEEYDSVPERMRYSGNHCISCELGTNNTKYLMLDDIDNTSDLTSSPPPPISSPSCYSSSDTSPSSSSLNPLQSLQNSCKAHLPNDSLDKLIDTFDRSLQPNYRFSSSPPPPPPLPESSNHHESLSSSSSNVALNCDQPQSKCHLVPEKSPSSSSSSCCPLCCPDPEVRITDTTTTLPPNSYCSPCTKPHLLPYYPPTVSSIRDAVSHLTRLDDFNVVKLSHGFFSQVFKVIHFSTKKVMVLKMNKEAGNRGNALKEIELLNKLNHENIVAYMGTVVHEGALHPLLEFINGGTLEQLIHPFYAPEDSTSDPHSLSPLTGTYQPPSPIFRQSIISPKVHRLRDPDWTFMKLMRDVSRGMDYLHTNGYLHRDLASKNIFIRKLAPSMNSDASSSSTNQAVMPTNYYLNEEQYDWYDDDRLVAVIGDFGFATTEPAEEQKLSTVGSPYWLAPECFKNLWYNHKCDIYSFGVICCELNWRIPADPDYLPRFDDNFAVDFGKLVNKKDTPLGKVAKLACNIKPTSRPEFSTILDMFDFEMNKQLNSKPNVADESSSSTTLNGTLDASLPVNLNDTTHLNPVPSNGTSGSSSYTFKRGYSLDSSMLQSVHLQLPPAKDLNYNESDIFEQHLLRRRYSTALAKAANRTTRGTTPAAVAISNCSKSGYSHHHVHHYHQHQHHQHHHLLHRNLSNPLPDIRRETKD